MSNDKSRMLIYINGMASLYLKSDKMQKYISEQLRTQEWVDCSLNEFPEGLVDMEMNQSFYHGVACEQYKNLKSGGVFVNPLMGGLAVDFGLWAEAINEMSHFGQTIRYLDIPYDVYKEATLGSIVDEFKVEQSDYDMSGDAAQKLVNALMETEQGIPH